MSKKQTHKKKVTLKINPGQAAYVADIATLHHIAETYLELSKTCESQDEAASWLAVADEIYAWSSKTYNSPEEDYEDEEW